MMGYLEEKTKFYNGEIEELMEKGRFYGLDSDKSEDIAAFVHFFLTVTPYNVGEKNEGENDIGRRDSKKNDRKRKDS